MKFLIQGENLRLAHQLLSSNSRYFPQGKIYKIPIADSFVAHPISSAMVDSSHPLRRSTNHQVHPTANFKDRDIRAYAISDRDV